MSKGLFLIVLMPFLFLGPAYAAKDLCNEAHMKQMDQMIADMDDAGQKDKATAALDKSKAAMAQGDNAECMKYMNEAHAAMGL